MTQRRAKIVAIGCRVVAETNTPDVASCQRSGLVQDRLSKNPMVVEHEVTCSHHRIPFRLGWTAK